MLGNILLSFFLGMPAVVAFVNRNSVTHPVSRAMLTWGGGVAMICAATIVVPLLGCEGSLLTGYSSCVGGAGISAVVAQAQPLMIWAAKIYILAGIPLAVVAFALDQASRRAT